MKKKNIFHAIVFLTVFGVGVFAANVFKFNGKFENFLHKNCVRWEEKTLKRSLFNLKEIKNSLGKRVISKNSLDSENLYGRAVGFEMLGQDKFF